MLRTPFARTRGAHVRHAASRRVMAGLVATLVGSAALAGSIVASSTQEAKAAAEVPGNDTLNLSNISATFGPAVINNSPTNRTTNTNNANNDQKIFYGVTQDKDMNPVRWGANALTQQSQYVTSMEAANNYWTYIGRGRPWMWEGWPISDATIAELRRWDSRLGLVDRLRADGQSAIGFKPNNPGNAVQPNTNFLIGTIRHNNNTILASSLYVHSDLRISFGTGNASVSLPFVNRETYNDVYTTIVPRQGGAYTVVPNSVCWSNLQYGTAQADGGSLNGGNFAQPTYVNGRYTGVATLRVQPDDTQPVNQDWKCVQHVGTGNGQYDLYNRPYDGPNLWTPAEMKRYVDAHPNGTTGYLVDGPWNGDLLLGDLGWPDAIDVSRRTPASDDTVQLTDTTQSTTITQNGKTYRFEVWGFTPANNGVCPAAPPAGATRTDTFRSKELMDTFGCLYGRFSEERTVTIAKTEIAESGAPTPVTARFTTTTGAGYDTLSGVTPLNASAPYVTTSSFASTALTPTGIGSAGTVTASQRYSFRVGNSDFTISENDNLPSGNKYQGRPSRWTLDDIQCVNGVGDTVAVTRTARGVNFKDVGTAPSAAAAPITCTFINKYQQGSMRVEKHLEANGATSGNSTFDVDYKITLTNDSALDMTTGLVYDTPGFARGLRINSAKYAVGGTQTDLATAPTADVYNGGPNPIYIISGPITNSFGADLPANSTLDIWVRFNVTLDPTMSGYNEANLVCTGVRGRGLFNEVSLPVRTDSDGPANNRDCGDVPGPPVDIVILKAGTQLTGIVDPNGWSDSPLSMPGTNYTYNSPRFSNAALSPLRGAEFAIYDADPATGATPIRTLNTASAVSGTGYAWDVQGLRRGTRYWLVETKAPAGHSLMPQPIEFTIGAGVSSSSTGITLNNPGAITWTNGAVRTFDSSWAMGGMDAMVNGGFAYMNKATLLVKDTQVGVLPKSGGLGIFPYIGSAVALVGGAMVINVVTTRRRRAVA